MDTARDYGRYARHLFELSRAGDTDAVELFLESMDDTEMKDLLRLMIEAGGVMTDGS